VYNTGASCFRRNGFNASSAAPFLLEQSNADFGNLVGFDSTLGLVVFQSLNLDIIAVNASTGLPVWQSYNITAAIAPTDDTVAVPRRVEAKRRLAAAMAATGALGAPRASTLVSGAVDTTRGLTYVQDQASLYLMDTRTGTQLPLSASANPIALGASIAGYGNVFVAPYTGSKSGAAAAVLQLNTFSDIPGVVTNMWFAGITLLQAAGSNAVRGMNVSWTWMPSQLRSACMSPASFSTPTSGFPSASPSGAPVMYTVCATNLTNYAAPGVAVFAVDTLTGAQLWSAPLTPALTLGAVVDYQHVSNLLLDHAAGKVFVATGNLSVAGAAQLYSINATTGAVLGGHPFPSAGAANGMFGQLIGVSLAGASSVDAATADHTAATAPQAAAAAPPNTIPFTSVVGGTPLGSLACMDVNSGALRWSVSLGAPPPNEYMYGVFSYYAPLQFDALSRSFWVFAAGGGTRFPNGTWVTGYRNAGVQASADFSSATLFMSRPTTVWTNSLPVIVSSVPVAGTQQVSLTVVTLGDDRKLTASTTALQVQAAGSNSVETGFLWEASGRGAVYGAPAVITNPADHSQSVFVFVGYDDDIIRCVSASSGALLWSTDLSGDLQVPLGFGPNFYYDSLRGVWTEDMLLISDWNGNIFRLSLSTGKLVYALMIGDHVAHELAPYSRQGGSFYNGYVNGLSLHDETLAAGAPPAHSLAISITCIGGMCPSILGKLLLPTPAQLVAERARSGAPPQGPPVIFGPAAGAYLVWNKTVGMTNGDYTSFGRDLTVVEQSSWTGTAATTRSVGARAGTTRVMTTSLAYGPVWAFNYDTGAALWTSDLPLPGKAQNGYYTRGFAVAPFSNGLFVAATVPQQGSFVVRLNAVSGAFAYATPLCNLGGFGGGISINPVDEATVYATCADSATRGLAGKAAALSAGTGKVLWWGGAANDYMTSEPALNAAAGIVYYGTAGGILTALNASTGAAVASSTLPGAAAPLPWGYLNAYPGFVFAPSIDSDGFVYVAGGDDGNAFQAFLPGVPPAPPAPPAPTPSPSPSPTPSAPGKGDGITPGAAGGIAAGVIVGLGAMALAGLCLVKGPSYVTGLFGASSVGTAGLGAGGSGSYAVLGGRAAAPGAVGGGLAQNGGGISRWMSSTGSGANGAVAWSSSSTAPTGGHETLL
jgi:hypothetical protein